MRYYVEGDEETFHRRDCPTPPPSYDMSSSNHLAPPDYHDALQDVLLDSGDNREMTGKNKSLSNSCIDESRITVYCIGLKSLILN